MRRLFTGATILAVLAVAACDSPRERPRPAEPAVAVEPEAEGDAEEAPAPALAPEDTATLPDAPVPYDELNPEAPPPGEVEPDSDALFY